jgi:hypothetical protein
MILNFLTINLGDSRDAGWIEFFYKFFMGKDLLNQIWFICVQEDNDKSNFRIGLETFLRTFFTEREIHEFLHEEFFKSCNPNFWIRLFVICPKSYKYSTLQSVPTDSKGICKRKDFKAVLIVKLESENTKYPSICVAGGHFPFSPLGYTFSKVIPVIPVNSDYVMRMKVFDNVVNAVNSTKSNLNFIFGDLNFRIDERSEKSIDQLLKLLKTKSEIKITNATNIMTIAPTCKTTTKIKSHTTSERLISQGTCSSDDPFLFDDPSNVSSTIGNTATNCKEVYKGKYEIKNSSCYHPARTPSYCDRVVYWTNTTTFGVNNIKSEVIIDPPIDESDHNGVYVQVKVEVNPPSQGGKRKSPKLTKNDERVKIGNRNAVVYKTSRGTKYVKKGGKYIKLDR